MTQATSRLGSGGESPPPRLAELLEKDCLDWDDPRQRAAYLAWWLGRPWKQDADDN